MATTMITNRVSLKFIAPMARIRNLKSSILRKPASVCFSNLGSSTVPRLAVATSSSSFNKHLFARGHAEIYCSKKPELCKSIE